MFEATIVWSIILALAIVRVADIVGEYVYDYVSRKRSQKNFNKIVASMKLEMEELALKRPVKKAVAKKKPVTKRK